MSWSSGRKAFRPVLASLGLLTAAAVAAAFGRGGPPPGEAADTVDPEQVLRGRALVIEHACGECHGGTRDPAAEGWLAGVNRPEQEFRIGPCAFEAGAEPCFITRPRNLTPDNTTGLGRFSERQIFNALRYGLRPGETADVEITSGTPGVGNFPEHPKYLAPPMPWPAWRHMPDEDLRAIAAYLKHGVKPVSNRVADSDGPPDFWASAYTEEAIGSYPAAPFPTGNEVKPPAKMLAKVLRGRQVVLQHDCGACHGGTHPEAEGWLGGITAPQQELWFGPCFMDPDAEPCFRTRPRNLTPDQATGTGGYSERQIFNALRYGLKPSETPDVEIPSHGASTFPENPRYLAPTMPWGSWRYMSEEDLWAVAAYLKHGVKPVSNEVQESDAPPDNWASESTPEKVGPYPPPAFPTANEVAVRMADGEQ